MIFKDKVVVITGAGSGVGRGLAAGFCKDGAQVVGFGRTRADLESAAKEFGDGRMHCVSGDLADAGDIARLFDETMERCGRVDVLVNNAALYPKQLFLESSIDEWARVIDVNVTAVARCCHQALPIMLKRGYGRIINVGTFAWKHPIPASSAYSASKGAIPALTKALASEIDRVRFPDVLVNELVPGVFKTRMSDDGEDPTAAYPHAKFLATLPANGPTGETFLRSEIHLDYPPGLRTRVKRLASKLTGGLIKA